MGEGHNPAFLTHALQPPAKRQMLEAAWKAQPTLCRKPPQGKRSERRITAASRALSPRLLPSLMKSPTCIAAPLSEVPPPPQPPAPLQTAPLGSLPLQPASAPEVASLSLAPLRLPDVSRVSVWQLHSPRVEYSTLPLAPMASAGMVVCGCLCRAM